MPGLITDDMLNEFCLVTDDENLVLALKDKYSRIADRLAVYNPFIPGDRDEFWKKLARIN
jgi:hypothetical protein